MATIEEVETPLNPDKQCEKSDSHQTDQSPICLDQAPTFHDQADVCHGPAAVANEHAPTSPNQITSTQEKALASHGQDCQVQLSIPQDHIAHEQSPTPHHQNQISDSQTSSSSNQSPTSKGQDYTTTDDDAFIPHCQDSFKDQPPSNEHVSICDSQVPVSNEDAPTGIKALACFTSPGAIVGRPLPRSISLDQVNRSGSPISKRKTSLPPKQRNHDKTPGSPITRSGTIHFKEEISKEKNRGLKSEGLILTSRDKQESGTENASQGAKGTTLKDENMSPILSRNASQRRRKMSTTTPPSRSGVLIRSGSPLSPVGSDTESKASTNSNLEAIPGTSGEQRKISTSSKSGEASLHQGFDVFRSAFRRRTPPSDGEEDSNLANFVNKVLHVQKFYKKTSSKKPRDEFLEKFTYIPEENRLPRRTSSNQQMKNHASSTSSTVSTGSEESLEETYYPFIFDPCGYPYLIWLAFVSMAVIYNYWLIIIRIALPHLQESNILVFLALDYFMDAIYILDIAAMFRTGYMQNGEIVDDLKLLRKFYTSTWGFYFDILAIIPLDFFYFFIGFNAALRLGRLLKAHRVLLFTERVETASGNPKIFNLVKLIHYLFLIINWVGCFYMMLSKKIGLGSEIWVYPAMIGDWAGDARQLIYSFFWSTMTMTTIGGVPRPLTTETMAINIIMTLAGIIIFATIVGQASDMIINMRMARMNFQKKVDDMKFYIASNNVPPDLQQRVIQWFDYLWTIKKDMREEEILNSLPDKFKTEIAIHVHLKTLRKVKLFEQCEPGFLRELVLKLKPQLCSPGDYVCHKGEVGKDMYIVNQGTLEVVGDEGKVLCRLSAGSHFGEISILDLHGVGNRRTASIRSVGFSDLFRLSKSDLQEVFTDFPDAKMNLQRLAKHTLLGDKTRKAKLSLAKGTQDNPRYWLTAEYEELRNHLAKLEYNKKVKRLTMVLRKAKQLRDREVINRFFNRNKCSKDPQSILKKSTLTRNGCPLTDEETTVAFQIAVEKYRMNRAARSDTSSISSLVFDSPQSSSPNQDDLNSRDVLTDEGDDVIHNAAVVNTDTSEETTNPPDAIDDECNDKDDIQTCKDDSTTVADDATKPIEEEDLFKACRKGVDTEEAVLQDGGREIRDENLKYQKIYSDLSDDRLFNDEDRQVAKMLSYLQNLVPVPEYLHRCDHVHDDIDVTRSYDVTANDDYEVYDMREDDVPLLPRPRAVVFNHLTVYPDGFLKPLGNKDPHTRSAESFRQEWNQCKEDQQRTESCWVPLSNCNGYQKTSWDGETRKIPGYHSKPKKANCHSSYLKPSIYCEQYETVSSRSVRRPYGYEKVRCNSEENLSKQICKYNQERENSMDQATVRCDQYEDGYSQKYEEDPLEKIQLQIKRAFQPVKLHRMGYSQVTEMDYYDITISGDETSYTKESLV